MMRPRGIHDSDGREIISRQDNLIIPGNSTNHLSRINTNFVGNDIFPCDWSLCDLSNYRPELSIIFKLKVRITITFSFPSSSSLVCTYICLVDRCWLWIFISSISINTESQSDQIRPTVGRRWKLFQVLVLISISVHDQRDTDLISNTATGDIIRWRDRTWLDFTSMQSFLRNVCLAHRVVHCLVSIAV